MTVRWNKQVVRNLTSNPEVVGPAGRALLDIGWEVAKRAAAAAPRDSGDGAASIHPELFLIDGEAHVRVSWDRAHFYMGFAEVGTEHQPPRPFLGPAARQIVGS